MPKEKHAKTPKRRYVVSYRAEDGSKLAEHGLKAEDSIEFEWEYPDVPSVRSALLSLLDVRMAPEGYPSVNGFFYADPEAHRDQAVRIVLGPMTRALEAIWGSAVEIKVSEAAA